jgi:hypothetical protein
MKILVACEFSGRVRDAFRALGHDAVSCDLLPSIVPGPHIQGDVRKALKRGWDLMVAHPPCTYLASSGLHWNLHRPGREQLTQDALDLVLELLDAPIEKIAIENPIGRISTAIQPPDQVIQPYQFGHNASKSTCLWLLGLPQLVPTRRVQPMWFTEKGHARYANQTPQGQDKTGPRADRWKLRSLTYPGIARAMAQQWGS